MPKCVQEWLKSLTPSQAVAVFDWLDSYADSCAEAMMDEINMPDEGNKELGGES